MAENRSDIEKILAERLKLDEMLRTRFTRKITVMFTDIKGSTSFYERRGDLDGRLMVHRHNELVLPVIARNRGVLIKTIGDATMSVYDEPADGLRAARQIQEALREHNAGRPAEERISVRIGLNTGLGIVEEKDVFGDVVNVASRVEALADGGEILATEALYREVRNDDEFIFRYVDDAKVKGKAQALKAYRLVWHEEDLRLGRTRKAPRPGRAKEGVFILEASVSGRDLRVSAYLRKDGEERAAKSYREIPFREEKLREYTSGIIDVLNRANRRGRIGSDLLGRLRELGGLLYDLLLPVELKAMIGKAPENALLLSIDDRLVHVPWELLHDGRDFLCQRFSIGRSVSTQQDVSPVARSLRRPLKMLILADPRGDLGASYEEGVSIKNEVGGFEDWIDVSLKTTDISADYARSKLRNFDIVHYAGHAEHSPERPEESGWLLKDGRLSAAEIMTLSGSRPMPALVFSNACQTGQTGTWRVEADYGTRIFGLANAFLLSGVQHYLGTFWEIPDEAGALFARSFYRGLAGGLAIGESLRRARQALIRAYGEDTIVWAGYMLYGDPTSRYAQLEKSEAGPEAFPPPGQDDSSRTGARKPDERPGGRRLAAALLGAALLISAAAGAYRYFGTGRGKTAQQAHPPDLSRPGATVVSRAVNRGTKAGTPREKREDESRAGTPEGPQERNDRGREAPPRPAGDQAAERAQLDRLGFEYRVENFLKAVADDNTAVAELFIRAGIDVNAKTERDGDTALLLAARNKNEKIAKMVLDAGANPNAENAKGYYPLYAAAEAGLCDVVKKLLAARADVQTGGPHALLRAVQSGFADCTEALLDAGARLDGKEGSEAASIAASRGHVDAVKALLAKGMDGAARDSQGRTALDRMLMSASYSGKVEMMQFLLDSGADMNCGDGEKNRPLMRAVKQGRDEAVRFLIRKGADVNAVNTRGETALMLAVEKDRIESIKALAEAGSDPSLADQWGTTPIMEAVRRGRAEAVQFLVKKGKGVNSVNHRGETALMLAVEKKSLDVVKALLKAKADPSIADNAGTTPLMRAARENWDEGFRLLARSGSNVNAVDIKGETALIQALGQNKREIVKTLLEFKADPAIPDKDGNTPLMRAVRLSGGEETVRLLIKHNAQVNAANKEGKTALLMAVESNNIDAVKALMDAKADVTRADKRGVSPLEAAKARGRTGMLSLLVKGGAGISAADKDADFVLTAVRSKDAGLLGTLLQAGADCSRADEHGDTPLMAAVNAGWEEGVRLMGKSGAPLNAVDNWGNTALMRALKRGKREIVRILLEAKADPGIADNMGDTPLITAVRLQQQESIADLLIKHGANVNARNKFGKTALHVAVEMNNIGMAKALMDAKADPNMPDQGGSSPLNAAKTLGSAGMVDVLEKKQ